MGVTVVTPKKNRLRRIPEPAPHAARYPAQRTCIHELFARVTMSDGDDGGVIAVRDRPAAEVVDLVGSGGDAAPLVAVVPKALSEWPHRRADCAVHPLGEGRDPLLHCANCYCCYCDVPAKDCASWREHCTHMGPAATATAKAPPPSEPPRPQQQQQPTDSTEARHDGGSEDEDEVHEPLRGTAAR